MAGSEGRRQRELTIAFAYFDQPLMLEKQAEVLTSYSPEVQDRMKVVIVDDCSHEWPITDVRPQPDLQHGLEVYRILDSFPWNQMGARNLAMHRTKGWTLLIDPDHTVPEELARYLLDFLPKARTDRYYLIPRVYARNNEHMGSGPNLYMVHSESYWRAGGMDEGFRGRKGWSDITFRDAMEATGTHMQPLKDAPRLLAWSWRDWKEREPVLIPDAAVTKLDRDIRYNEGKRNRLLAAIRRHPGGKARGWRDYIKSLKPLQFRWKLIYASDI